MAVENLALVAKKLMENGRSKQTPAAIVENVSLKNQRIIEGTLGEIAAFAKKGKIKPPAIVIIGEVVSLRKKLCPKKS
jgi:siroheme synthase